MKLKLCKELCKRCQNYSVIFNRFSLSDGWVWCKLARGYRWVDIKEIPEDCPYRLEHTVMGNQDENQVV